MIYIDIQGLRSKSKDLDQKKRLLRPQAMMK